MTPEANAIMLARHGAVWNTTLNVLENKKWGQLVRVSNIAKSINIINCSMIRGEMTSVFEKVAPIKPYESDYIKGEVSCNLAYPASRDVMRRGTFHLGRANIQCRRVKCQVKSCCPFHIRGCLRR